MNDQIYNLEGKDNVKFNLSVNARNILEKATERSIVYILHHYNHFNATWTNSQEETRAQVPPQLRRNGLWLSYVNNEGIQITERFIGKDVDAVIYEKWINSKYWENLDFELLIAGVKQAIENAFRNLDKFPNLKALIRTEIGCILRDLVDKDWLEEFVGDNVENLISNIIQVSIEDFLNGDDFKIYFKGIVEEVIGDLIDEYFKDIQQALWDEERVIANALARHELAITELQNKGTK